MLHEYPFDSTDFSAAVRAFLGMLREWPFRECPDEDIIAFAESMPAADFRAFIHTVAVHDVRYAYLGDLEIDEAAVEWIRSAARSGSKKFNFAHGDFGRTFAAVIQPTRVCFERWGDEDYPGQVDTYSGLDDLICQLSVDLEDQYLPDSYVRHLHDELEIERIGLIFRDIEIHEEVALREERNGRTGFFPLGKMMVPPCMKPAPSYGAGAVLREGAAGDVLFLPVNGYEEVRIVKKDGTEIEVPLPSKIAYRNMSAVSPAGTKLAVVSNVRARVVDLKTGECKPVLEGPWMTGVACMAGEFMAVLTEGGPKKLNLKDPDVRELSSLKTVDTSTDSITIGCSAMVHVLDMKGASKLLFSCSCTADSIQAVMDGRVLVLRRYTREEGVWGTAVLGCREGDICVLAKYPRDIGRVFEKDGYVFSERGFRLTGLEKALENVTFFRIEKIGDSLEIEAPPELPPAGFYSSNNCIHFESVDSEPHFIALPSNAGTDLGLSRSDWIPDSSSNPFFPILRYSGGRYEVSLGEIEEKKVREIPLSIVIRTELLVYQFSTDAALLLLSIAGGNYLVKTATGEVTRISDQLRNVESAEIIDNDTIAVLSRLNQENSQLDIWHRDGGTENWTVVSSLPTHALNSMRYIHENRNILISFKLMPRENSIIAFFHLTGDFQAVPVDTAAMTMEDAWSDGTGPCVRTREGSVYRYNILQMPEAAAALSLKYELPASGSPASVIVRSTGDTTHCYGYIDRSGNMVIAPRWSAAQAFSGSNAEVGLSPHGFYGLVNVADSMILPAHASWIGDPRSGYRRIAFTSYPSSKEPGDALFGIIGPDGRWLLPPEFSFAGDVHEERAAVQFETGEWNWVTTAGNRLSPDRFQSCSRFSEGLASAMKSGLCGYVNRKGEKVIDFRFNSALPFCSGLAGIRLSDDLWRCIDEEGTEKSCRAYHEFYSHMEGFAVVRSGENWGYVDASGREPFGMGFQRTYSFTSGLGVVLVGGRWNFITEDGNTVSEKGWDGAFLPSEGMGSYMMNSLYGFVNCSGETVTGPVFSAVYAYSEGLSAVQFERKWGYIDKNGDWVISPRFAEVRDFKEGLAPAREAEEGLWGYIDRSGDFAVRPRFREAYIFSSGLAVAGT
jgi:hypothetical protein